MTRGLFARMEPKVLPAVEAGEAGQEAVGAWPAAGQVDDVEGGASAVQGGDGADVGLGEVIRIGGEEQQVGIQGQAAAQGFEVIGGAGGRQRGQQADRLLDRVWVGIYQAVVSP